MTTWARGHAVNKGEGGGAEEEYEDGDEPEHGRQINTGSYLP